MMSQVDAADMLEIELSHLQKILKEQNLVDAKLQPTEDALLSGFIRPEGSLTKRGMSLLITVL